MVKVCWLGKHNYLGDPGNYNYRQGNETNTGHNYIIIIILCLPYTFIPCLAFAIQGSNKGCAVITTCSATIDSLKILP